MNPLNILPIELWNEISKKLDIKNIFKFRLICKFFYENIETQLIQYAKELVQIIRKNNRQEIRKILCLKGNDKTINKLLQFIQYYFNRKYSYVSEKYVFKTRYKNIHISKEYKLVKTSREYFDTQVAYISCDENENAYTTLRYTLTKMITSFLIPKHSWGGRYKRKSISMTPIITDDNIIKLLTNKINTDYLTIINYE